MNEIEELKSFLLPLGFEMNNSKFINQNLLVYYRESHKEWRLKDNSYFSSLDISTINFPLDEKEQLRIRKYCSQYYQLPESTPMENFLKYRADNAIY